MTKLNDYYLRYYSGKDARPIRGVTMKMIIEHSWSAGICKEQTLIDCMIQGYALCVAGPAIERIWAWWDASYAEYCKTQETENDYVLFYLQ